MEIWREEHLKDEDFITPGYTAYEDGILQLARSERARTQSIDALWPEVIEALKLRQMHDDDCFDATEHFKPDEMCECGATVVQAVLTKLKKACEGEE